MELADKFHELKLKNDFYKKESLLIGGITFVLILILFFLNEWRNSIFYTTAFVSTIILSLKFYDVYNSRSDKYYKLLGKLEVEINEQIKKGSQEKKEDQSDLDQVEQIEKVDSEHKKFLETLEDFKIVVDEIKSFPQKYIEIANLFEANTEKLNVVISQIKTNVKSDLEESTEEIGMDLSKSLPITLPNSPRLHYYFGNFEHPSIDINTQEFNAFLEYLRNANDQYHTGMGFVDPKDNMMFLYKVYIHFKSKEPKAFKNLIYGSQGGYAWVEPEFSE